MSDITTARGGIDLVVSSNELPSVSTDESLFPDNPATHDVLIVTVQDSPDEWLHRWRSQSTGMPARLGFVTTDDATRATLTQTGYKYTLGPNISIRTVSEPADLTGLCIGICAYLEEWADSDNELLVYVDSLTPLFREASREAVTQFLTTISTQVNAVDGHVYVHLDRDAHEEHTITGLKILVDGLFNTGVT